MFSGSIPALITPLRNGAVDERAFQELVDWQIKEGSSAVVPCGTTGESATLSHEEHRRVIALCVEAAAKRVPVIAGAGSNATAEAVALTKFAKEAGADAVLSATGYYNKPSQEGIFRHFEAVAKAADIPVIIYNVPTRTIVEISVETVGRLAKVKTIAGIKDASPDLGRVARQKKAAGAGFALLSGNDDTAVGFHALGGVGCISVTANVAPRACAEMQAACAKGDYAAARAINDKLAALHHALFLEPSPGPIKYAASLLGRCTDEVRLPLLPPTEPVKESIQAAMKEAGLIN